MNKAILIPVFFVMVSACLPSPATGQSYPVITDSLIKTDSMNLAVLVLDFLTYTFEKANISCYPLFKDCDRDSLPFRVAYKSPGDFGDVKFFYRENDQLLFGASIIWMGTGIIYQPSKFRKAGEFPGGTHIIEKPSHPQYFDYTLTPYIYSKKEYMARADSAWASVKSLEIVNEFASRPYRTGFYAWPPSVGVFCPSCAKWIIFLYSGNPFSEAVSPIEKEREIVVYPVPAKDELFIEINSASSGNSSLSLYNSSGSLVLNPYRISGRSTRIDLSGFASGLYYMILKTPEGNTKRKVLIFKN